MKKIIRKFWTINLLLSIALFIIYRVVIAESKSPEGNVFESFLYILDIFLNLSFSAVYLAGMVICSLTFFLNLMTTIRNNYLLSFLSFSGLPLVWALFILINVAIDIYSYNKSIFTTLGIFSIIYLSITAIEFIAFRKRIQREKNSS